MKQTAPVSTAIVFLLALNLRPAVTSLGAALEDVSLAPGMTAAVGAVLVALPLWASGIGGWITPWLKARIGIHRAVTWALILLGISLVVRVQSGAELLIAGTALACLAIAVVGTVLPVLVQPASSRTKASFTLALGAGSTIGALVTPTVVAAFSWQFALAGWAALAAVTVHVWQKAPRSSMVFMARALNPRQLFHSRAAWHLTVYFGLVSTLTFLIMGWLPAILRDAGVSASYAGFCLALSMAMGLPMMWLVPFGVHRMRRPGILVVLLAAFNGVGVVGLLVAPAVTPWLWSTALGLGMGGLAMGLTTISVRAAGNPDITTALSGMVQGLGYFIAGAGALACGLVHSATDSWELPLIMALFVLCGQVWCGVQAARPIVIAPRAIAVLAPSNPEHDSTHLTNGVRVTAKAKPEPRANGVRVTAKGEPTYVTNGERVTSVVGTEHNGVKVTAELQPEPLTNGVRVTASALEPDVTQPISGVWIAAVAELESVRSKPDSTQLTNGVRVTALSGPESDVTHPTNGVRVTAESDVAQPSNGVRVTATTGPESDAGQPSEGVRVTAEFVPDLAQPPNGMRAESDVTPSTNGVRVTVSGVPEPNSALPVDGVRVTVESDLAQPSNGVRVTAATGPESDVAQPSEGVRVTAEEGLALPVNGVRVTAVTESDSEGIRVTVESEPGLALPVNGVRVTAATVSESDVAQASEGVRVTAKPERLANGGVVTFTNGAGIRVPRRSEPELPQQDEGVRVTAAETGLGDQANGTGIAAPRQSEEGLVWPFNGVRVTGKPQRLANGGSQVFTNGAGVRVPRRPEPELPVESELVNGVRDIEPESAFTHLSNGVMTALAEAVIPLPRQPIGPLIGPPAGPPIVQSAQPETATQEG